jgi:hypothetical protein
MSSKHSRITVSYHFSPTQAAHKALHPMTTSQASEYRYGHVPVQQLRPKLVTLSFLYRRLLWYPSLAEDWVVPSVRGRRPALSVDEDCLTVLEDWRRCLARACHGTRPMR